MNRIGRQTLQYGSPRDIDQTLAMLEAVRPSDVQDLAQELFEPNYFHAINLIPQD
jgi:predicted Zn-dependent peptidase